jgi:hypothetical protein
MTQAGGTDCLQSCPQCVLALDPPVGYRDSVPQFLAGNRHLLKSRCVRQEIIASSVKSNVIMGM